MSRALPDRRRQTAAPLAGQVCPWRAATPEAVLPTPTWRLPRRCRTPASSAAARLSARKGVQCDVAGRPGKDRLAPRGDPAITHLLLWARDPDSQLWFSTASLWEVAIKYGLGRHTRSQPSTFRRFTKTRLTACSSPGPRSKDWRWSHPTNLSPATPETSSRSEVWQTGIPPTM